MDYGIKTGKADEIKTPCIIVGIFSDGQLTESAALIDKCSKGYLTRLLKNSTITGELGESQLLFEVAQIKATQVLLVGCGSKAKLSLAHLKKIHLHLASSLKKLQISEATNCLTDLDIPDCSTRSWLSLAIQSMESSFYRFDQFKSSKNKKYSLKKLHFLSSTRVDKAQQKGITEGCAIASGINIARDLGNLPGNVCTPTYLANEAKKSSHTHQSISTQILSESQMEKLGLNSLLAVSQGSEQAAKLIIMQYNGGKKSDKPEVLVGKGVTFDSGGISLKPGAGMDEMKYDMCGAASVFGTLHAVAQLALPINVVGIVPAVENMPDGSAARPGDIVKTMAGKTVEILNTDAEGRLILCDALTYAEKFKPANVIDIATLTGACVIALGAHATAVYSNNDQLSEALLNAGRESTDRGWPMPLWDDYQEQLDSPFADIANIGGRAAGSITAACFLSRFTENYSWAHLDIAGSAWVSGGKNKGGTGRPVAMLTQYLMSVAVK